MSIPNITPFDEAKLEIDELFDEAQTWFPGGNKNSLSLSYFVETQESADTIAKLLNLVRKATNSANTARIEEKRPHDEAGKAVQAKYRPILDRAELIANACKMSLAPFLEKQEQEAREAERKAREEAEVAELAAQQAMQQTSAGDIAERAQAESMLEDAKAKTAAAAKLSKARGQAKGGERATSLRTTYEPNLISLDAAIRHYWKIDREAFEVLVTGLAKADVKNGATQIPGFEMVKKVTVV